MHVKPSLYSTKTVDTNEDSNFGDISLSDTLRKNKKLRRKLSVMQMDPRRITIQETYKRNREKYFEYLHCMQLLKNGLLRLSYKIYYEFVRTKVNMGIGKNKVKLVVLTGKKRTKNQRSEVSKDLEVVKKVIQQTDAEKECLNKTLPKQISNSKYQCENLFFKSMKNVKIKGGLTKEDSLYLAPETKKNGGSSPNLLPSLTSTTSTRSKRYSEFRTNSQSPQNYKMIEEIKRVRRRKHLRIVLAKNSQKLFDTLKFRAEVKNSLSKNDNVRLFLFNKNYSKLTCFPKATKRYVDFQNLPKRNKSKFSSTQKFRSLKVMPLLTID